MFATICQHWPSLSCSNDSEVCKGIEMWVLKRCFGLGHEQCPWGHVVVSGEPFRERLNSVSFKYYLYSLSVFLLEVGEERKDFLTF